MPLQFVRIYTLGRDFQTREVGRIYSDGTRVWPVPEQGRAMMLATQPIFLPGDGDRVRRISPDEPQEFLNALPKQYNGTRLWCGQPETDLADGNLESSADE